MNNKRIVVLGAGAHARVISKAIAGYSFVVLDDDPRRLEEWYTIPGWKVVGPISQAGLNELGSDRMLDFIVGIGSVSAAGCGLRDKFYQMALSAGLRPLTVSSQSSEVLGHVGDGVFVGPRAIVMPGAIVEPNCIINTGAIVEHDCKVGWSSHIATGAILCGGVEVGKGVHVGAGAMVRQGVKIGDGATIGMGAVVLVDVQPGLTVVGNPAQDIERFKSAMARLDKK